MIIVRFSFMIYWHLFHSSLSATFPAINNLVAPVTAVQVTPCSVLIFPVLKMFSLYVLKSSIMTCFWQFTKIVFLELLNCGENFKINAPEHFQS